MIGMHSFNISKYFADHTLHIFCVVFTTHKKLQSVVYKEEQQQDQLGYKEDYTHTGPTSILNHCGYISSQDNWIK